ncbi:unnamed protein product, partial [Choristocarpus tenellus]
MIAVARRLRGGRADVVLLTAKDLRSLTEKHNADLREELLTLQPCITKKNFFGCGVFLNTFERKGRLRGSQVTSVTYELMASPGVDECRNHRLVGVQCMERTAHSHQNNFEKRMRDCRAVRIDGVIHRVLQASTKEVVTHVQREV